MSEVNKIIKWIDLQIKGLEKAREALVEVSKVVKLEEEYIGNSNIIPLGSKPVGTLLKEPARSGKGSVYSRSHLREEYRKGYGYKHAARVVDELCFKANKNLSVSLERVGMIMVRPSQWDTDPSSTVYRSIGNYLLHACRRGDIKRVGNGRYTSTSNYSIHEEEKQAQRSEGAGPLFHS